VAATHTRERGPLNPDAAGRAPTAHALGVFVRLAETLHFGQAATTLGLAQSSLSEAIRRLEAKLDVVLLERTSSTVWPRRRWLRARARRRRPDSSASASKVPASPN